MSEEDEEAPKAKVNFNREVEGFVGDDSENYFKQNLVQLLKNSATVTNIAEADALRDLRQEIARSEGPIEVTKSDLDRLEKNMNKALNNQGSQIPNKFVEEVSDLLSEGRLKLEEVN